MEQRRGSLSGEKLSDNDRLLHAMYCQKPNAKNGETKIKSNASDSTASPTPLQDVPKTPTTWDSSTIDAIEIIYEKLVQVNNKCRTSRTKMSVMRRKKDEQIEELALKCARLEEELKSKHEELAMVDAGLQKIMKITERVDQKITEREGIDFSNTSEKQSSELKELRQSFKKYEASAAQHIVFLNTEIRCRDTGLIHAISVNQELEAQLLQVRDCLTQQATLNYQLESQSHALKLKVKHLESEAKRLEAEAETHRTVKADTFTKKQYLALKEDEEQRRKSQKKSYAENMKAIQKELKREEEKTQKQERELKEQEEVLSVQHDVIEQQQADLELSIKALERAALSTHSTTSPDAEIEDLNDKLLERDLHIEELDKYIDTIEKGKSEKVDERTSQTVMDRQKAEERAREWRKVSLDQRLDEARKSIIAEDCFLKCLLVGREEECQEAVVLMSTTAKTSI